MKKRKIVVEFKVTQEDWDKMKDYIIHNFIVFNVLRNEEKN